MSAIRDALDQLQGDQCGICGAHSPGLVLDHDHDSGLIRGYLCARCNRAEGRHGHCAATLACPICEWRATPAVSWLGWTERYDGPGAMHRADLESWKPTGARVSESRARLRASAEHLAARLQGALS